MAQIVANAERTASLGLPHVVGSGHLALVGGGPSVREHLDELRAWDGEVWGINGAASWLADQGIDATFCTLHPGMQSVSPKVRRCVLGDECSPELYESLKDRDIRVLSDRLPNGSRLPRGPSTVTGVAIAMVPTPDWPSFTDITFFGCECSYGESTHLYDVYDDPNHAWVIVRANGQTFRTKTEFLNQAVCLAEFIHRFPTYREKSGGLLSALVQDHEYDVMDAAPWLLRLIELGATADGDSVSNISP